MENTTNKISGEFRELKNIAGQNTLLLSLEAAFTSLATSNEFDGMSVQERESTTFFYVQLMKLFRNIDSVSNEELIKVIGFMASWTDKTSTTFVDRLFVALISGEWFEELNKQERLAAIYIFNSLQGIIASVPAQ